jgi:hypothetical protein
MPEKKVEMSTAVNWSDEISTIAGKFDGNRKGWLSRAARKADKILSAADQARLEEAKRDAAKLADIYQSAAQALGNVDPDFHRDNIDALVNAARILGALDRA